MEVMIGTVLFGGDYGVHLHKKKLTQEAVNNILAFALEKNVTNLDTAQAYNSESILGNFSEISKFNLNTKLKGSIAPRKIETELRRSLEQLSVPRIKSVMFHSSSDILGNEGAEAIGELKRLQGIGLIEKIGCSVYDPKELGQVLRKFKPDVVQIPLNIFDQRFIQSGMIDELHSNGTEVHARSVFLQGLVFLESFDIPFSGIRTKMELLERLLVEQGISRISLVKSFLVCSQVDKVVLGISAESELDEFLKASIIGSHDWKSFSVADLQEIDPRNWSNGH